jgi:plasmid stabilization system protein ParE
VTVRKSASAEADIIKIWLTAERDYGVTHAKRVVYRLDHLFGYLDQFPEMGRQHPRLRAGVRYFQVRTYPFVVFFEPESDGIRIVRILHERMRAEKHL